MKKILPFLVPAIYFILGVIFILAITNFDVVTFLDSGFFIALVTFGVGLFGIYLYKKQQNDNKRDSAKLILQEIRYAEQQVRNVRTNSPGEPNYYMAFKLLPTNNWHKNIHLFVNDLQESQLDLISNFYSMAGYLDKIISTISTEKMKTYVLSESVVLPTNPPTMNVNISTVLPNGFHVHSQAGQQPTQVILQANPILADVTTKIEFIYNSPAVDRLRQIAEDN